MGALLESGMVGNIGLKHLKVIKEDTLNKWNSLGFLDGLKGHVRENIAQLYENQATNLINEATTASDSGSFETVVFPIIRRVFSKLLANDIVSVQAMNLPIGKLFYFVPKIAAQPGGQHYQPYGSPMNNSTDFPGTGMNPGTPGGAFSAASTSLYDQYYAGGAPQEQTDGLYDYSRGSWTASSSEAFPFVWSGNELVQGANVAGCKRTQLLAFSGFAYNGGKLIGPDGSEQDSETFLASLTITANQGFHCCDAADGAFSSGTRVYDAGYPILFRLVTQKYGVGIVDRADVCDSSGKVYVELDLSCPACINCASGATSKTSIDGYVGASGATGIKEQSYIKSTVLSEATVNTSTAFQTFNILNSTPILEAGGYRYAAAVPARQGIGFGGIIVPETGIYMISASMYFTTPNVQRASIGLKFAIASEADPENTNAEGVALPETAAMGYIRSSSGHNESSVTLTTIASLEVIPGVREDQVQIQLARLAAAGSVTVEPSFSIITITKIA